MSAATPNVPREAAGTAAAPQPPYSLIGPFQDHLKFHGRPPRTLAEKLQARADWEHARRTAELKKLAAKLALLEPLLPQLAALGAPVHDRDITLWHVHAGPAALRIPPSIFSNSDDKLHAALLSLGFREVEASAYGNATEGVTLKLGRALLVRITITQRHTATAPAPATAREGVAA